MKRIKLSNGEFAIVLDNDKHKLLKSVDYNFGFDKETGFFARWGKTKEDDGILELGLPEIADIEISTICKGVKGSGVCKFCYKSNTPHGKNMSLDTFKKLFSKLPPTITQIAFGIGDIDSNPDMWGIFDYTRSQGVVPNVTVNGEGVTDEIAERLANTCGAVAVSLYNSDLTYETVEKLTGYGLKQVNIHCMISEETYDISMKVVNDKMKDERLKNLNAIVFLSLKSKGRAIDNSFTKLSQEKFNKLSEYALSNDVSIGFDSCSSEKFILSLGENKDITEDQKVQMIQYVEPCESSVYSSYFNTDGEYFPCSFIEGTEGWEKGEDAVNCENFIKDIWLGERASKFRSDVIGCRKCSKACPVYDI